MKKIGLMGIYLLGFPATGVLVGYLFFRLVDAVSGPLNDIALEVSIIAWGGFGVIAGIYGVIFFLRMKKSIDAKIERKEKQQGHKP